MAHELPQNSAKNDSQVSPETEVVRYARHDEFNDGDHLSATVRHANLELLQQSCGRFRGDVSSGALGGMMVQFIRLNQTSISRAINAPDRLAVLVQVRGLRPCIWNGYASHGSSVITYGPGHEHFGVEPKKFECAFISIPIERIELLLERCHRAAVGKFRSGCHQLKAPIIPFVSIQRQLAQLKAIICSKPTLLTYRSIRQMFEQSLEESLLSVIHATGQDLLSQGTADRQTSGQIVRKAEQFLECHPDRPIHLIELCSAVGSSPELLKRAFCELLNIDPRRYLRLYRLHRVRTTLLASNPLETSVELVARSWGFWSPLWFKVEYQRMFSEPPSRTLARAL
jgi:AraC family ethanolamine operon transcriptional activator